MVYQGPSRGCNSCKQRRKKCDETRPSCMRCIKANRSCGGYEDATSKFRQYEIQRPSQSMLLTSTARKCSMPVLVPIPGTDIVPEDALPSETSQAESNWLAIRAFFYDYCVISSNQNISRGFLSGLETMAYRLGQKSDLAKACQAISFASHGKPLQRPRLVNLAETYYQELLGSLAKAIENPSLANTMESKMVAMMLGLYQITMANETDPGNHEAHSKGLAALMKIENTPLSLLGTIRHGHISDPSHLYIGKMSGIFSVTALSDQGERLDDLLITLNSMWTHSEAPFQLQDFVTLRNDAIALDRRFAKWQASRVLEFQPIEVGHVNQKQDGSKIGVGYWPGRIDAYFDLYVAGVWNIFRAARLLLIALIINLSDAIEDNHSCIDHIHTAHQTVEDMIASIPYHLADSLQVFLNDLATSTEITNPGRLLGGLLLIHPVYVAFKMPFLSDDIRDYMQKCLIWIGTNMGLGQATLLAKVRKFHAGFAHIYTNYQLIFLIS